MCEGYNITVTKCESSNITSCDVEQSVNNDEHSNTYGEQALGEGVPFERIRRITGYLVGTLERFNDAKKKEVEDRVKHSN